MDDSWTINTIDAAYTQRRDLLDQLVGLLRKSKAAFPGLLGAVQPATDSVVVSISIHRADPCSPFGKLLMVMNQQGQLARLFVQHFSVCVGLKVELAGSPIQQLRICLENNTTQEQITGFMEIVDSLLEAVFLFRTDLVCRPLVDRPAPLRVPFLDSNTYPTRNPAQNPTAGILWELRALDSYELARYDASLLTYDNKEAGEVGAQLVKWIKPFRGITRFVTVGNRVLEHREVCVPFNGEAPDRAILTQALKILRSEGFSGGHLALSRLSEDAMPWPDHYRVGDGAMLTDWLIKQTGRMLEQLGRQYQVRLFPDSADKLASPRHIRPAQNVFHIKILRPGTSVALSDLHANTILVDFFAALNLSPTPELLERNILYIRGASLRVGNHPIQWQEFASHLGHRPALLESLLMTLSELNMFGCSRSDNLCNRADMLQASGLAISALQGFWGEMDVPHWRAFFAQCACVNTNTNANAANTKVTVLNPAIGELTDSTLRLCDQIFCNRHLQSSSRLIDPSSGVSVDYRQLQQLSRAYAGRLTALGAQPGQTVAYVGPDDISAAVLMLACFRGDFIFAPLNPTVSAEHFAIMLRAINPRIILFDPQSIDPFHSELHNRNKLTLEEFLQINDTSSPEPEHASLDTPAVVLFTSGSTGTPKAVVHTQADFLLCGQNYGNHVLALQQKDCVYTPSRLFFAYGLNNLLLSLQFGASHVLAASCAKDKHVTEVIHQYHVSVFLAVPAIFKRALTHRQSQSEYPSLRLCVSAGEKLTAKLCSDAQRYFGVPVLDGIGSTEALSTFISNRISDNTAGSSGKIVPGFKAKLVNERGELCRVGEIGVLWLRGNTLTKGYLNDVAATQDNFDDGWLNTRDLFFVDADNRFYNVGRLSSVIKINACWFSPDLLESTLAAHPAVAECAVCMVNDEYGLPRPKAYVVVKHNEVSEIEHLWRELRALAKERLGKHNYPHLFTEVQSLPRTSSGKLMRSKIVLNSSQIQE